jgi:hypothetical protein
MNALDVTLSWLRSTPLACVGLRGLEVAAGAVRKARRAVAQKMQQVRRSHRLEHEPVEWAGQKPGAGVPSC